MLHLRLFGAPVLERDGVALAGRATQRHRVALLALLALAPARRSSRDKLIATLWPDSDAERGRNLLKVSSYVLRQELGETTLLSAGDDLCLNADVIGTDVADFEAALEQGDHARAAVLYTGPFLDGFFIGGAPEFEQWADRERERLAGGYRNALERLAEAAVQAGDLPRAVEWWKARAAHDPYDSRVALRLMEVLEASGNRAGALQHAAVHQRMLETEFGMAPPPDIVALAERLRREPAVEPAAPAPPRRTQEAPTPEAAVPPAPPPLPAAPTPAADPPLPADPPAFSGTSGNPRRRFLPAALALVVLLAFAGALRAVWPRASDPERSIVVLPFVNMSGEEDNEFFSDGLTEEIITRLAAVPGLKVISRTSAMHYKGTTKPLPQIAEELRVDHILEGSVRQSGGLLRISAQLIDARSDGHLWADAYDYGPRDAFRAQEEIAGEVVRALEVRLGERARRQLARQGTHDAEAYQLYRRGRFLWNARTREGHERAIEYYQRALERDSSYAEAYAGLADVYLTAYQLNLFAMPEAEAYSRLKWAAERALAADDESADAHVSFAIALLWQQNWPGAEREFRRALQLNPGHATARSWYSLLLRGMERSDDALRESRLASELDPFAVVVTYNYGWQCYIARDYDCAIEQFGRSLEITDYPSSHRGLGFAYAQTGRLDDAIASVRKAIDLAPHRSDFIADLAYVQALAGRTADARASLERAKQEPWEAFNVGRAHVALGEPDSAFAWLERSNWRWPHRAVQGDPALDPLRSDPRFARLVQRVAREMGMR